MGKKKPKPVLNARNADKYRLYQESVQEPLSEVSFIAYHYKRTHGRPAMSLREDFCGTGLVSAEWVKSHSKRTAVGVDLDASVLVWGLKHNFLPIGRAASRVKQLNQNVLKVTTEKFDVIAALNFSYFVFKKRADLLAYFRAARASLKPGGMIFVDCYGGPQSQMVMCERTRQKGFTYIWDQHDYNPVDSTTLCYIHFGFPDGSTMRKAFTYDWRLWQPAEIQEALTEAGFNDITLYWEGDDLKTGGGNGIFRATKRAENCDSWIAYISACR
ncbi:MAG: class I SAM-dependent methyltransferase [Polyangiaceae bacterium]|nr:class I SAM-dependent methyltransferase [Planctomycetota bacterium]MCK6592378.1 class I SAM-dependent methyltransferase [Polyangiaceae bacterium]NUQ34946.1 class I SAM-dependent methyltransferase [Planctomycetaceae bacterium]